MSQECAPPFGADAWYLFQHGAQALATSQSLVVADGKVIESLALPIAGLLSEEPLETVVASLERLERVAKDLGATLQSPFATLSFLALPVIPELRLTDLGLVDVNEFKLIE